MYCYLVGIQKIMVPGTSVKSSKEALRLTRLYPGVIYSTAGKILMLSKIPMFLIQ